MNIKKLTASFGTLKNETLELAPGLNIVRAPNERGKSSWASFIRAIFFGVDTSARKKGGVLPDKTRFLPWSGAAMEGSADLFCRLGDITLERTSRGSSPMEKLTAVFTGSATPVPELNSENAGEVLLGISEQVFTRSAFISQLGMRVDSVSELEKKISSLISTGDEDVSYSSADAALRAWQRKIRYNKIGELPDTEAKIKELNERLAMLEAVSTRAARHRLRVEELAQESERLSAELKAHDIYAQTEKADKLKAAKAGLDTQRARLNAAEVLLSGFETIPTMPEIASLKGELSALSALDEVRQKAVASKETTENALLQAHKRLASSPVAKAGGEDLTRKLSALESGLGGKSDAAGIALIICAVALGIISVFAAGTVRYALIAVASLAALAGILNAAGIITILPRTKKTRELVQFLSEYGASSASELRTAIGEHSALTAELTRAESEDSAAKNALMSADESYDTACCALLPRLKLLKLDETGHGELLIKLTEIENHADEYWISQRAHDAAQKVYAALSESLGELSGMEISVEKPASDRRTVQARYDELLTALSVSNNEYNASLGEMRGIGDPLVIGSEKMALEERLSVLKTEYECIGIAIDTLEKANTEMQTRFAPILNKTAGAYMSRLTGTKYESLMFDKNMSALAKPYGETVSRELGYLSAGTADQVYLALRLAIIDLCLPEEEDNCPVVLDDALVNFDDRRCEAALDLLMELSEKRQIIAFTCHNREAKYCQNRAGVNIIDMYQL